MLFGEYSRRYSEQDLLWFLNDETSERDLRLWAIVGLRRVGTDLSVDALAAFLVGRDRTLASAAREALSSIGTEHAVEALTHGLQTADPDVVLAISRVLAKLDARDTVPALIECLDSRREQLPPGAQRQVIRALGLMPHRSAIPVLAICLRDQDRHTRSWAAWALARIRAPESTSVLEAALSDVPWRTRREVRKALRARRSWGYD